MTRDSVQLRVNTPATLDLRMKVGSTADVVNVAADATAINTVDATIGYCWLMEWFSRFCSNRPTVCR